MKKRLDTVQDVEDKPLGAKHPLDRLVEVMAALRNPDGGCPWDLVQDFKSIVPYTIEEAYEVADAIERADMDDLREELGDLLLQSVYHAQMASEQGCFTIGDVIEGVTEKMIARHPHVFGDARASNPEDVNRIWEERKAAEKPGSSALEGVARALPALMRAQKLQNKAAKTGFEWPGPAQVLDKLEEELAEMREALACGSLEEKRDELGDLMFVLVNLGRMMGLDAEEALRHGNDKFERRFKGLEIELKLKYKDMSDASLVEMKQEWVRQKQKER
ncbi:MAG: nucleoside triphosphate pyrophosphohydrolase [Alphaproteobacteria bacterium]|nr:nucleoside triphosphate pyrophosphohydrolase [Alphaproteobacteria bacterium]